MQSIAFPGTLSLVIQLANRWQTSHEIAFASCKQCVADAFSCVCSMRRAYHGAMDKGFQRRGCRAHPQETADATSCQGEKIPDTVAD